MADLPHNQPLPVVSPFAVLVDSNESQPFTFHGLKADAEDDYRPLLIETRWSCLGRYPHGLGDYSIEGCSDRVAVERKAVDDCWATVMGWDPTKREGVGRRERFKSELENLAKLDAAMVVVEGSLERVLSDVPEWGEKPADVNRKIFFRSVLSMMVDFGVPWLFCDSRRLAEVATYRFLATWWRKNSK